MATSDCTVCNDLSNIRKTDLSCTGIKDIDIEPRCVPGLGGDCGTFEECTEVCEPGTGGLCGMHEQCKDECYAGFDRKGKLVNCAFTSKVCRSVEKQCDCASRKNDCKQKPKFCDCANKTPPMKMPTEVTRICNQNCPPGYSLLNGTAICQKIDSQQAAREAAERFAREAAERAAKAR